MKIKHLLVTLLILIGYLSYSQSSYLVGTSQEGIEPDQSLISLHLAGYGAPRDGRFTLQWINKGSVPEMTAMAGMKHRLYIISKGDLFLMNPSEDKPVWRKTGKAENLKSIAGSQSELYAIDNNGVLLKKKVTRGVKWQKIGDVDKSVTGFAASDKKLYVANENGSLWSADLSKNRLEWITSTAINNIVSLATNNRKLYALTSEGVI